MNQEFVTSIVVGETGTLSVGGYVVLMNVKTVGQVKYCTVPYDV